jgi:hypothetical protein
MDRICRKKVESFMVEPRSFVEIPEKLLVGTPSAPGSPVSI